MLLLARQLQEALTEGRVWASAGGLATTLGLAVVDQQPNGSWTLAFNGKSHSLGSSGDLSKAERIIDAALADVKIAGVPEFTSYAEVEAWKAQKIKEYGGKSAFLTSPEYHAAWPLIKKLADEAKKQHKNKAGAAGQEAMKTAGLKYGDVVYYRQPTSFGGVTTVEGELINRAGIPTVKLTDASREMTFGRNRFVPWDQSWKKKP